MGTAHQQPQNHQTLELPPLETRPPREKTQQSLVYNHETLTAADVGERPSKETGRSCSRTRVPSRKRVLGCLLRGVVSASSLPAGVVIKWFCRRAREEGRAPCSNFGGFEILPNSGGTRRARRHYPSTWSQWLPVVDTFLYLLNLSHVNVLFIPKINKIYILKTQS